MFDKILVATDGSAPAKKAVDVALELTERCSASLLIVSVAKTSEMYVPGASVGDTAAGGPMLSSGIVEPYHKEVKTTVEKMLAETLKKAKEKKPTLNISTKLMEGHPAERLIEAAKQEKPDLLVMGHRGLSGIKELVLGSVSNRVTNVVNCPVLIIK